MTACFRLFSTVSLAGLLILAGCSLTPTMPTPEAERALPDTFASAPADGLMPDAAGDTVRVASERWWTAFGDSSLTALVDTALAGNFDLTSARARVSELAAQFRIARAPLFPDVNASGEARYQSQPANTGIGGALGGEGRDDQRGDGGGAPSEGDSRQAPPDRFSFTTYQASLGLSYELDFWGRVRDQRKAALNQYFATAADLQTARISVVSQTISTYFEVASLRRQVALGRQTVDLLRQRLAITEDRYARGLTSSFQVYTVRQSLEAAEAEQPQLESDLYDARSRLSTLLGRFVGEEQALLPDSIGTSLDLDPVPAGMPADLLMQRPDVRAEALRLEAARREIGVARAERLPSLSLTGTGGTQSSDLASLVDLDQRFANFAAQLTAPLVQGGRLQANIDAAEARYRQQAATYESTVLTAFREVNAALVADAKARQRLQSVNDEVASARASVQTQRDRYERGIGEVLALLDAERGLIQAQTRRAAARRAAVNARLALHRALGGSWTAAEPVDDPRLLK